MFLRHDPPKPESIRAQLSTAAGRVGDLAEAQTVAMIAVAVAAIAALAIATMALCFAERVTR